MELCPVVFEPRLVPKLWGGRRLADLGKAVPEGASIGESWEIYDDDKGSALASLGPARGLALRSLSERWGEDFRGPGRGAWAGRFPLLVKMLDAGADLSVQVHPDDELAVALEGPGAVGKSEAFVVLQAAPGAVALNGWLPGVSPVDVRRALASGHLERLLNRVPVHPGDVMDVPPGRPHALGAGCLVAEVQQNSELTYRLWDYQRLEDGRLRDLHVEQALRCLRFDEPFASDNGVRRAPRRDLGWGEVEVLVEGPYFTLQRLSIRAPFPVPPASVPKLLMVLAGQLRLAWGGGNGMMVPAGSTVLLPAALAAQAAPGPRETQLLWIEPR